MVALADGDLWFWGIFMRLPGLPTTRTRIDNILCVSVFLLPAITRQFSSGGCETNPLTKTMEELPSRHVAILVLAWPRIYGLWILSNYMLFLPAFPTNLLSTYKLPTHSRRLHLNEGEIGKNGKHVCLRLFALKLLFDVPLHCLFVYFPYFIFAYHKSISMCKFL